MPLSLYAILNSSWLIYSVTGIYVLSVVVILGIILSENRNPVKSLAWVTVLVLLPVLGIILYIFFGRNIRNTHMISRRNRRRLKRAEHYRQPNTDRMGLSETVAKQVRLGQSLCGSVYYPGNDVTVYTNGTAKFTALAADLRAAQRYINLQYYIFDDDRTGTAIADILIERARAGVTVRVIYDHVGSIETKRRFFRRMSEAGVQIFPFFRVAFPPFGTRINWRNHRKLCVVDGEVGYIGGMNIADRYIDGGKHFDVWRDTHLRITGPAVRGLQYSFAVDWNFMGQPLIEDEAPSLQTGTMGCQLITSGPMAAFSNIEFMYMNAIGGARKRIYLQTPYFLPTDGLLKALQTAAMAHVDVRIMIPEHSDSRMLRYAGLSYVSECLQSGIKVYLYQPGMLHSKTLIVDDEIASVGSANFDFRSFEHNFEANMFVYSADFNRRMTDIFMSDMRHSKRLLAAQWRKRSYVQKAQESVLRLLSPIL